MSEETARLPDLNQATIEVANAIDATQKGKADNLIRLSTGVVLKAKEANSHVLIRVMTASPRPLPPIVFDEMMGREMENPNNPDYISRVKDWELQYSSKMLDALIGLGTELIEFPTGMEGPNGNQWLADYKSLGLPANESSTSWRYITWVLFKAAVTANDTKLIGDKVRALSGVQEAAVRNAETFPKGN